METTETTQPSLDGLGFSGDFVMMNDPAGTGPEATINERWYRLYSHSKAMCELMLAFNTELEPGYAPQGLGVAVHDQLSKLENLVTAARILITPAIAATGEWKREGAQNPEGWFAGKTGKSRAKARAEMETGKNLGNAPGTREAFLNGELSAEQADTISDVAEVNPEAEQDLLNAAKKQSLKELKDEAARRKAEVEDIEERERRLHKKRYLRTWTDSEGAWHLHAKGPVPTGADFQSVLERLIDQQYKQVRKNGVRGTRDNYAFDALMTMGAQHGFGSAGTMPTDATPSAPEAPNASPEKPNAPTSPPGRATTGPAPTGESNGRTAKPQPSNPTEPAEQTEKCGPGECGNAGTGGRSDRSTSETRNTEKPGIRRRCQGEDRSAGTDETGKHTDEGRIGGVTDPDDLGNDKGGAGGSRPKPKRPTGPTSSGSAKHPPAAPENLDCSLRDAETPAAPPRETEPKHPGVRFDGPSPGTASAASDESESAGRTGSNGAASKSTDNTGSKSTDNTGSTGSTGNAHGSGSNRESLPVDPEKATPRSADADEARAGAEPSAAAMRRRRLPVSQQQIYCIDWDALVRGSTRTGERCELRGVAPVSVLTVRTALASSSAKLVITDDDGRIVTVAHLGTGPINVRLIPGLVDAAPAGPSQFGGIRGSDIADSTDRHPAGLAGRLGPNPETDPKTVIIRVRGRSLLEQSTGTHRANRPLPDDAATGGTTDSPQKTCSAGYVAGRGDGRINVAGLGEVSRERARVLLGDEVVARLVTRGQAVRSLVHTGRAPNAAQRIALAWADTTCSVEGCPNQRVEIDHRSPWATERTTVLDNLDPLCAHHHGQKSARDAARRTGTSSR